MKRVKKINVALLCGGRSAERDVSLSGADEVERAFEPGKFSVRRYDALTDIPKLVSDRDWIDMVFILLHGRYGEDGTVQGMLELLDLPYQGSDVTGSALAMNKHLSKIIYRDAGIPTPEWLVVERESVADCRDACSAMGFPLMVKPCSQGSSVGMGLVGDVADLESSLNDALKWDDAVMIEKFVQGRELTVGVLEEPGTGHLAALPAVEILPGHGHPFFDYRAKYDKGEAAEICPAPIADEVADRAAEYAICAHRALGLRHYSRTDMMLADTGGLFVIETNTIPGMTPTSLLPQAASVVDIPFPLLLERLVALALENK